MTRCKLVAVMLLGGAGGAAAQAPGDFLYSGSAHHALATGPGTWCAIDEGVALFRRVGSGPLRIGLTPISVATTTNTTQTFYTLVGQHRLVFASPTAGTVYFDNALAAYPAGIKAPTFSNYVQNFNATSDLISLAFKI